MVTLRPCQNITNPFALIIESTPIDLMITLACPPSSKLFPCCDPFSLGLTSSVTVVGAVLPQAAVGTAPSQAATIFLVHIFYGLKADADI